jgi:hypothetical protein
MNIKQLFSLLSETCAYMNIVHPDYGLLGARVAVHFLHLHTEGNFLATVKKMYHYVD